MATQWFREVKTEVPSAKVLFVGTKADLRQSQHQSQENQLSFR